MRNERKAGVYVGPPLKAALDAAPDHSLSGRVNTIAERYMEMVRRSTPALSAEEWSALVDLLNSTVRDPRMAQMLHIEVSEGMRDGLADKWGIDGARLAGRVEALPFADRMAILEIVDRYWARQEGWAHEASLEAAGAVIVRPSPDA